MRPIRARDLAVLGILLCLPTLWACETRFTESEPNRAHLKLPILSADTCASCHVKQNEEWRASLMSYLAVSPFFNGLSISVEELVGRNIRICPEGAGPLRRAPRRPDGKIDTLQVCSNEVEGQALSITGAGGEHWCVNCHIPSENIFRTYIPPGETEPLVPGVPAWSQTDPKSRGTIVDTLSNQGSHGMAGLASLGEEGRVMMEGATCDTCHQVTGPALRADDALARGVLDKYLDPTSWQGNPIWESFLHVEGEAGGEPCVQDLEGKPMSEEGERCRLLFRDGELVDGNSGYLIDPDYLPEGAAEKTRGTWRMGPRLDPAPVDNTFHNSIHVPVDLRGDTMNDSAQRAEDPRYDQGDGRADYYRTSNYCGTCHDVRIFGTDTRFNAACEGSDPPEECFEEPLFDVKRSFKAHKDLRQGYTEHRRSPYAKNRGEADNATADILRSGASVVTCQDCHMSSFPGALLPADEALPEGCEAMDLDALRAQGLGSFVDGLEALQRLQPNAGALRPVALKPGCYPQDRIAEDDGRGNLPPVRRRAPHTFTGVDLPLDPLCAEERFKLDALDDPTLDDYGQPLGHRLRRDLLLKRSVALSVRGQGTALDTSGPGVTLRTEVQIENVAAGHRVPAGFTQEREMWVEVVVVDLARAPADFTCGDGMTERLAGEDLYPRLSRCASALAFGEPLPAGCDVFEGEGGARSLEDALGRLRQELGVLAHMGALVDRDHDELVVGLGPEVGEDTNQDGFIDALDYATLFGLFDPGTGQLRSDAPIGEDLRVGANRIFLLDKVGDTYRVPAGPEDIQGELRIVERADGHTQDEDIPDKVIARARVGDDLYDAGTGALVGTYGMDVLDGPYPSRLRLSKALNPEGLLEADAEGLINFQNGFLRCVACCPEGSAFTAIDPGIQPLPGLPANGRLGCVAGRAEVPAPISPDGTCCRGALDDAGQCCEGALDAAGACQASPLPRARNLIDGNIDLDIGICQSNLVDDEGQLLRDPFSGEPTQFFEVFSPVGALTPDKGVFRGVDGIINERSLLPGVPYLFRHALPLQGTPEGNLCIEARLNFRTFPPYMLRTFAGRELIRYALGDREPANISSANAPFTCKSPTMSLNMPDTLDVVEMAADSVVIPRGQFRTAPRGETP